MVYQLLVNLANSIISICSSRHDVSYLKLHQLEVLKYNLNFSFMYHFSELKEGELVDASSTNFKEDGSSPPLTLVRKEFSGRYAISSEEFTSDMVSLSNLTLVYVQGLFPFLFCNLRVGQNENVNINLEEL
jgi:hypothetical protein